MEKIKEFLLDVKKEMSKVSWPTQEELRDNTIMVVVFSLILSAFIYGVDRIYSVILKAIYQ
jgi:preprotein translocase subunit SecE